ncbi:hypothetical protein [Thioalkalivibrio sp. HK1]|uniref:hypothetical protein n=1 Tax=Thioalkalivibrio sp. HK1 TaxID=1469245 RepID=UPI00046F75A8|nr:hypothetical protein [Thioalkalivibrio sp. HK1]
MLRISDILIEEFDLQSFEDLVQAVKKRSGSERFLRIDIKPPFADTPENWEDLLESAFVSHPTGAKNETSGNAAFESTSVREKGKESDSKAHVH